jgi:hypothetical protein
MDVVAPPAEQPDKPSAADPFEQLVAEDQASHVVPPAATPKATKPATAKAPRAGVGLAISATVVIVLGLAALATYAYLQTAQ